MSLRVVTIAARAFLALLAAACVVGLAWGGRDMLVQALSRIAHPGPLGALAVALVAGGILARIGRSPAALLASVPAPVFAVAVFVTAVCTAFWAHRAVHKGVPEVPDEMGYLHQARTFADGHLVAPSPPAPEFHYVSWGTHDDGQWYAVFPPGYGVLLAVGERAGSPGLVNPVLSALLALVVWLLAREVFGRDGAAARVAVLIHVGSWFRLMNAGSFMSHPTAALFGALAVLGLWKGVIRRDGDVHVRWWAAGGGLSLAYLGATRQLDAVVVLLALLPPLAWAVVRDREPALRRLVIAVLCGAPLVAGYLAYNRALTGDAFVPPQQRYMQLKERKGDCFRLGFGPGVGECPLTQNTNFGRDGFQPKHAVANTRLRLAAWTRWSFGWVPLALLPVLGLLGGAAVGGAAARRRALCAAIFVTTVGGYALFFYHGVAYGARFYYVALPFAGLLAAAACSDIGRWLAPSGVIGRRLVRLPVAGAVIAGALGLALPVLVIAGMGSDRGDVEKHCGRRVALDNGALLKVLHDPALRDALVFVDSMKVSAAMTAHPAEVGRNRPLIVKDLGDAANAGFARIYPDRRPVRLRGKRVSPLSYPADAPMRHEGGALYPLERARGGFGWRVPADWVGKLPLSGGEALRFDVDGPGRFGVPVWALAQDAGEMTLTLQFAQHPKGAVVNVLVDGVEVVAGLDTAAPAWRLVIGEAPVHLTPGRHWVEIVIPAGRSGQVVFLDYLELRRRAR